MTMENTSVLQLFAIAKDGLAVLIDDVERGLACNCICPQCKEPLVAKQGDIRVWHFAHASGSDCLGGAESALHLAAKQIIQKHGGLMLPGLSVIKRTCLEDGRRAEAEASIPESWIDFSSVILEEPVGAIRPDVIGVNDTSRMIIEIAVSHFVDEPKRDVIVALGWPAIEISINPSQYEKWDWNILQSAVIDSVEGKAWLHTPILAQLIAEAEALALEKALAQTLMNPSKATDNHPPRTRFKIQGVFVDVIDLPFGIAVWSPYNREVNEIIKSIVKPLGGRWQPKYTNWLLNSAVKPALMDAMNRHMGSTLDKRLRQLQT
jgi:competence protein CoiA